jgi:hypothetical protein
MDVHPPIPSNADGRGSLGAGAARKEGWAGLPWGGVGGGGENA